LDVLKYGSFLSRFFFLNYIKILSLFLKIIFDIDILK
jgi:hypothetical protein